MDVVANRSSLGACSSAPHTGRRGDQYAGPVEPGIDLAQFYGPGRRIYPDNIVVGRHRQHEAHGKDGDNAHRRESSRSAPMKGTLSSIERQRIGTECTMVWHKILR